MVSGHSSFVTVTIYADSRSSAKAIFKAFSTSFIVKSIFNKFLALGDRTINIGCVKGHVGIIGNEHPDEVDKSATLKGKDENIHLM